MKKFISAVSVLLLLSGCKKSTEIQSGTAAETSSETSTQTAVQTEKAKESMKTETSSAATPETAKTSETTAVEETAVSIERTYMENENLLLGFIAYLRKTEQKPEEYFVFEQGNSFDQYDFFYDFKIDGYSYQHRGDGSYNVELVCSESSCELFPDGVSYWYFRPGRFCRYEELENNILFNRDMEEADEPLKTAYFAAVDFSFYTDVYEADAEWFENYVSDSVHGFYHAYNPYMEKDEMTGGVYPEEHIRATKKLYNITIEPESFDYLYDSENSDGGFYYFTDDKRVFSQCWHGAGWYYTSLETYGEEADEIKVTVNFYGDEMYLYTAIQSEYTFSKNGDGTITLQRVEKIFDSGYNPASGSV